MTAHRIWIVCILQNVAYKCLAVTWTAILRPISPQVIWPVVIRQACRVQRRTYPHPEADVFRCRLIYNRPLFAPPPSRGPPLFFFPNVGGPRRPLVTLALG